MNEFENVERLMPVYGTDSTMRTVAHMASSKQGSYVRHEDYEALLASHKELVQALKSIVTIYRDRDITRQDETRPSVEWDMMREARDPLRNEKDGGAE